MDDTFELRGAVALVTGATGGIGQALARLLASKGAELVLTGRRMDVLEPLAAELGEVTAVRAIAADLSDPVHVDRLLDEAGRVDVLVANAALPASGDLLEYTPEQIRRAITVNLEVPILMARSVAGPMRARRRGHIVMVGSMAGINSSPQSSMYNATKFGLRGFALGFRQDLRDAGVGVSIVEPGFVREAGMFVEGKGELPRGVRTVAPVAVASGVVRAIERNRAEVLVAPTEMRVGARVGGIFPDLSASVQRRAGADKVTGSLIEGQRHKR